MHHGRRRPRSDGLDRGEDVAGPHAAAQGRRAGALDDGAVQDRVGVRQADLDQVDAGPVARRPQMARSASSEVATSG
jgi:hypothetical protein